VPKLRPRPAATSQRSTPSDSPSTQPAACSKATLLCPPAATSNVCGRSAAPLSPRTSLSSSTYKTPTSRVSRPCLRLRPPPPHLRPSLRPRPPLHRLRLRHLRLHRPIRLRWALAVATNATSAVGRDAKFKDEHLPHVPGSSVTS